MAFNDGHKLLTDEEVASRISAESSRLFRASATLFAVGCLLAAFLSVFEKAGQVVHFGVMLLTVVAMLIASHKLSTLYLLDSQYRRLHGFDYANPQEQAVLRQVFKDHPQLEQDLNDQLRRHGHPPIRVRDVQYYCRQTSAIAPCQAGDNR